MLIEMAIPEIEIEANLLLARMTDNRMSVKMETQRETKKGDVMETWISIFRMNWVLATMRCSVVEKHSGSILRSGLPFPSYWPGGPARPAYSYYRRRFRHSG